METLLLRTRLTNLEPTREAYWAECRLGSKWLPNAHAVLSDSMKRRVSRDDVLNLEEKVEYTWSDTALFRCEETIGSALFKAKIYRSRV